MMLASEKIKELWMRGKSIVEIQNLLGLQIDVTDIEIKDLNEAMLQGTYRIILTKDIDEI